MRRLAALAAVALLACRADFVEKRRRVAGPVPEVGLIDAGGGHLRFALKGPGFVVEGRRKDAFRKMTAYCGGEGSVRVEKEYAREDVETPYNAQDIEETVARNLAHYKIEEYRHIEFRCVNP